MSVKFKQHEDSGQVSISFDTKDLPTSIDGLVADAKTLYAITRTTTDAVVTYSKAIANAINSQLGYFDIEEPDDYIFTGTTFDIITSDIKVLKICSITHTTPNRHKHLKFNDDNDNVFELVVSSRSKKSDTFVRTLVRHLIRKSETSDIINVKLIDKNTSIYEIFVGDNKSTIIIGNAEYSTDINYGFFVRSISNLMDWDAVKLITPQDGMLMSFKYSKEEDW